MEVVREEWHGERHDRPRQVTMIDLGIGGNRREEHGADLREILKGFGMVVERDAAEDWTGVEQQIEDVVEPPALLGIAPHLRIVNPPQPEGLQTGVIHVPPDGQHRHRDENPLRGQARRKQHDGHHGEAPGVQLEYLAVPVAPEEHEDQMREDERANEEVRDRTLVAPKVQLIPLQRRAGNGDAQSQRQQR